MAKQKFTHFVPRDKPKKRRGIHKKTLNKSEKRQKKLTRYKGQGRQMKWMLVVYICSAIEGECRTPPEYPKIKDNYYECVQHGLGEAYELLFGDSIFTREMIINSQLYPQYRCTPVEDKGKIEA